MSPVPIPIGEDLELRPVSIDDAQDLFAAIDRNHARLKQWLPWVRDGYDLVDTVRFLEAAIADNEKGAALTMTIRDTGVLCGAISLHRINQLHRASSLGYWIDAGWEGQGIVTKACCAMVKTGFRVYALHRIEVQCATGNVRSRNIPGKLGFTEEGILRDAEWLHDHWVDLHVFSMLEHECTLQD